MVAALMLVIGLLFPLTGLSMVAALLAEWSALALQQKAKIV